MTMFPLNEGYGRCELLGVCFISLLSFPRTGAVIGNQWIWEESKSAAEGTNVTLWWAFGLVAGEKFSRASIAFIQSGTVALKNVAVIVQNGGKQIDVKYQSRADITREGQNVSLTLTNVTLSDDGVYSCKVETSTDFLGKTKTTVLEVTVDPMIVSTNPINKNVIVNKSQPFSLSCTASGKPTPTLVWSKTSGSPLQFPDGTTLTVSSASSQHNGTYQCTATNKAGSDTATLVVNVLFPPKITIRPLQQTVCENQPVTISCNVEEGIPEPEVIWRKNNDATILTSSRDMSSNYSIGYVNGNDSGNYSCLATNAAGTEKKTASLHVEIAAKVSFITPNGSYERNTPVTLECSVTGDPSPNVTLINITDGSVLMNSTTETNHIKLNVSLHHKGIYRCMAKNKCGSDSRETTINVYDYKSMKIYLKLC